MSLSAENNFLRSIVNAGADAFSNLYEVEIVGASGSPLEDVSEALTVRCSGVAIPEASQEFYTVRYLTAKIDRPAAKVNLDRKLKLKFRVDANLTAYYALLTMQGKFMQATTHQLSTSLLDKQADGKSLFDVTVNIVNKPMDATKEELEITELATFKDCWISEITPLSFSPESANPVEVEATINFTQMNSTFEKEALESIHK